MPESPAESREALLGQLHGPCEPGAAPPDRDLAQTKSVSINSLVASLIRDASKRWGGSGDEVRSVTAEKVMAASKASKKKSKREAKVVQHKRKASTR